MRLSHSLRLIAVLAAGSGLVLAACSDEDPTAPDGTATSTAIPTATPYAVEPDPIIVGGVAGSEPTPPGATGAELSYVIEPGDALETIAAQFGVTVDAIMELNGIEDPATIFAGQELLIPGGGTVATPDGEPTAQPTSEPTAEPTESPEPTAEPTEEPEPTAEPTESPEPSPTVPPGGQTYVVQDGDSGFAIADAFGVTIDALAEANGMTVADLDNLQIGQEIIIPAAE
jgi:LysM repeat protein